MILSNRDIHLLSQLGEASGAIVADMWLPEHLFGKNRRSASIKATNDLKALAHVGLVKRLDDQKPIAWLRTQGGTDCLNKVRKTL